jgi:hypothetical protein
MVTCLALALLLGVPPDQYDTVVLKNGGILRGAVVEDLPGASLVLELTSGDVWTIPRSEIERIDYARGASPPEDAAPPLEAVPSLETVPALQAGVSIGLAIPLGRLDASGLALGSTVSPQLTVTLEGSFRPSSGFTCCSVGAARSVRSTATASRQAHRARPWT